VTDRPLFGFGAQGLVFPGNGNRRLLARALLLSLAAHLVLLFDRIPWSSLPGMPGGEAGAIRAELRGKAQPPVEPPRVAAPSGAAERRIQPVAPGKAAPSRSPAPPEAKPLASVTGQQGPPAIEAGDIGAAIDAESLTRYRLELALAARRLREYPEAARRLGLAGVAEVAVIAVPGERLPRVELARGSGFEPLDRAALEMIGRAARTTPLPAQSGERPVRVHVPVHFNPPD